MNPVAGAGPGILSSAWRSRWLVLTIAAVVVALGLIYQLLRPSEGPYEAIATIIIQEPVQSGDISVLRPAGDDRFVASQVEIMQSLVVTNLAVQELRADDIPAERDDIEDGVQIRRSTESPLVSIVATDRDPVVALAYSNAVAEAYREVSQQQTRAASNVALARIDAQISGLDERIDEIDAATESVGPQDPDVVRIQEQAAEAVAELGELQEDLLVASGDLADSIRQEIADLRLRLEIYEQVQIAAPVTPEVRALLDEQDQLLARRTDLVSRRDEIAVDADLSSDALALIQLPTESVPAETLDGARLIAVTIVLGLGLGVGVAYLLGNFRVGLGSRTEPAEILGVPLLAEVPNFDSEELGTLVPTIESPRSAAAEAFRFASRSLEVTARGRDIRSVAIVSATVGHGKTVSAVNSAVAAAANGRSVLVLDGDFGNQRASQLLLDEDEAIRPGISDVVEGVLEWRDAVTRVELGDDVAVDLMGRGTRPRSGPAVLASPRAEELIRELGDAYDLVIIDSPPLLQVAYASTLAEYADGVVVVVAHRTPVAELDDLVSRLRLIGKPVLGYIYNFSPLRPEMVATEGSMMDVLGGTFPPPRE